jgi:hypothetical protein
MWCAEELAIGETNEMVLVDHGVLRAQQPALTELTRGPSLAETQLVCKHNSWARLAVRVV